MKRIESEWLIYKQIVIPINAPEIQVRESKRAFYAGALTLLNQMVLMVDPGSEPTEEDLKKMDEINRELLEFNDDVKIGAA